MAPLDDRGEQYCVLDRPLADPRAAAMGDALALCRAAGDARRRASAMTVPFDPLLENLRRRLLMYAWSTRHCGREEVAWFRDLARNAIGCYRALRRGGAA